MDKQNYDLNTIWRNFKSNSEAKSRELLIEHYIPLVKYIAGRMAIHLPDNIDMQDLLSYGFFGLMDAVDKYDPDREIKFETYASTRIRGSILDGLRSTDWVPRSVRKKARLMEQEIHKLENIYGRSPTSEEVAVALDMPINKYNIMVDELRSVSLLSLDEVLNSDSESEPIKLLDTVKDNKAIIDKSLLDEELKQQLAAAIDHLTEKERLVIALYYYEGLTLKEIGSILEVSESRVCQIHSKAIGALRSRLNWL